MSTWTEIVGSHENYVTWWQMSARASIVFVFALTLYRLVPRRAFSGESALDFLVIVLLGSSLSRALTGNAPLLATMAATGVLLLLYVFVLELARRSKRFSDVVKGRSIPLIKDGQISMNGMRRARLGPRDLEECLRLKGAQSPDEVMQAQMERNGEVSVQLRARQ